MTAPTNPWRASGTSIDAPPEAWLWAKLFASRAARASGWPPAARAFVDALAAASEAPPPRVVPSAEVVSDVPERLVELDVGAVAVRLGCSPRWVRILCDSGRIQARKVGRQWLIDPSSIDRETPKEGRTGW